MFGRKKNLIDPTEMYALWKRDIDIEVPPNSGEWVQAKPIGMILGSAYEISNDVFSWFASPVFNRREDRGPVYVDDDTRVFYFAGNETQYRVTYSVMERRANVGGVSVPLVEDPFPVERKTYVWDQND